MTLLDETILLIEDSPTQIMDIRSVLEDSGLFVVIATDGETGVQMAKELLPSMIILDLQMPRMNGFQVIQELKNFKLTASIPIIMFTAHGNSEVEALANQLGVVEYILKDAFSHAVLIETLRQMGLIKEESDGNPHFRR